MFRYREGLSYVFLYCEISLEIFMCVWGEEKDSWVEKKSLKENYRIVMIRDSKVYRMEKLDVSWVLEIYNVSEN